MRVRDIRTSHLLTPVRVVYSIVQHTVLPKSGNTDVMTEVDQMVMFSFMTRRKINLVRLILDFIISDVGAKRRRHATLPYDMFLTRVFTKAQFPLDGQRPDTKRPTTTMKTFSVLGLKSRVQEKEKEKESKKKKDTTVADTIVVPSTKKSKSKPLKEGKKKKYRRERSLYPIPKERRSKRRLMKLVEESSSSSMAEDGVSAIAADPINMADTATTPAPPAPRAARPVEKGIITKKPIPEKPTPKEIPEGKGKNKVKGAFTAASRDSTHSTIRRARKESEGNKVKKEAWFQKQRNRATGVGAYEQRSSSISQEVEQRFGVIDEVNPPSEMRRVVMPLNNEQHKL